MLTTPPPKPPPAFVIRWAKSYNAALQRAHQSVRIVALADCKRDGEALAKCVAFVYNNANGKTVCFRVTVSTDSRLWKPAPRVPCVHPGSGAA